MSLKVDKRIAQRIPQVKETWVKVGVVKELTGWDKKKMQRARENNLIKQRKDDKGIWYLLESIHEMFIKKPNE